MIDENLRKRIINKHVKSLIDQGYLKATEDNVFEILVLNKAFIRSLRESLNLLPKGHVKTETEELLKEFT